MPPRHPRNHAFTTAKSAYAAKSAWKIAEKAAIGLARWATTDHTGTVRALADRPSMKAMDAIVMGLVNLVLTVVGSIASAGLLVMLFTFGVPLLLFF